MSREKFAAPLQGGVKEEKGRRLMGDHGDCIANEDGGEQYCGEHDLSEVFVILHRVTLVSTVGAVACCNGAAPA